MSDLTGFYQDQGGKLLRGISLRYYEDCLSLSKTVLGENHSNKLRCVIALANLYIGQGEYGKAFPLFEECLKNKQVVSREEHPDTLTFMNTLALLYRDQGEYGKALPLFEECLSKRKAIFGENSAFICMLNLAITYDVRKEHRKALFEECLNMMKVVLGDNHPYTLKCVKSLEGYRDSLRLFPRSQVTLDYFYLISFFFFFCFFVFV